MYHMINNEKPGPQKNILSFVQNPKLRNSPIPQTAWLTIPLSEPEAVLGISKKGVEGSVYN